jgi:DNA replication protein DnaC
MQTSNVLSISICETCRSEFSQSFVIWNGKPMFHSRNCESCCEVYNAKSANDPARHSAERKSAFRATLPKAFRETDRNRLPPVLIQAVEDYRYGSQGLAFIGKSGAGKTRAMMLLMERLAGQGRSVVWITSTDLAYCAADQFSNDPQEKFEAKERLQKLRTSKVAFIDDLGKGRLTDRMESELFDIIDTRIREELPTFWTSNSNGKDLFAMFSPDRAEALMRRIGKDFTTIISL